MNIRRLLDIFVPAGSWDKIRQSWLQALHDNNSKAKKIWKHKWKPSLKNTVYFNQLSRINWLIEISFHSTLHF